MKSWLVVLLAGGALLAQNAQNRFTPGPKPFVAVEAPVVALEHVRIIDGTGAPPREDQTLLIDHGKVAPFGAAVPAGAQRIDLTGSTVMTLAAPI
jgi:hypothetical protein